MPSGEVAPHQTKAASSVIGVDFIPGTTSPVGNTMLAVASPSSKSLAVVWRKDFVTAAVAVEAVNREGDQDREGAHAGAAIVRDTGDFACPALRSGSAGPAALLSENV